MNINKPIDNNNDNIYNIININNNLNDNDNLK